MRPLTTDSLQKQVSVMSMNLSAKLDELQRGDRHLETTVALCEIRTQLQELTKSVESCQSEVSEVSGEYGIRKKHDWVRQFLAICVQTVSEQLKIGLGEIGFHSSQIAA